MPGFEPFRGVRYVDGVDIGEPRPLSFPRVCAPPYDVIDEAQRAMYEHRSTHNAVRLILPRDGAVEGDRYARAAKTYRAWRDEGSLAVDAAPRFYGYRMQYVDPGGRHRETRGVIGALALPARPGEGDILPHEQTMAKTKSDRLELLRATRLNLDPIWGLTLAPGLGALVDVDEADDLGGCIDDEDAIHRLYAIEDPGRIAAIRDAVASAPIVLADGHHRFETACAYRDERTAALGPGRDRGATAIMALVVELADDQLCIEAIHRLVTFSPGFEARAALADAFSLTPIDAVDGDHPPGLVLVERDAMHLLGPRDTVLERELADEAAVVRSVDAAIVEHVVAPRWPDATWTFRHDADEILAQVRNGSFDAGLVLRPPSVATTRAAASARVRMPQKTTFFYPKPRTGLVFRDLDEL